MPTTSSNDRPSSASPDPFARLEPYLSPTAYAFISNNVGFVLVGSAQFFFACMNITVKYFLSITPVTVSTLILVRMSITSACSIIALHILRDPNPFLGPPEQRKLLFARGFAGFVGLFSAYKSYVGLSVSDATAISYLVPSLSAILAFLLLGERCSRKEIFAGLACLGGVLLISRPPILFGSLGEMATPLPGAEAPSMSRMEGVAWALVNVCGATSAYLLIRKLGHDVHALHTLGWFAHMCTIAAVFIVLFTPGPTAWVTSASEFILIITIGIFGFIAQILLTLGIQRERVGKAGVALYLSVFFSIILELLVFHTFPAFLSILGIVVILSSAYLVAKAGMEKKDASPDLESQPLSRSPSPSPAPSPNQRPRTLIAQNRSYSSTSNDDSDRKQNGNGFLAVKPSTSRRSSGASDVSKSSTARG